MKSKLKIEIFADIICPWCYIGKKRLENALSERPDIDASIQWKGFLLNPSIPQYGIDRRQYLLTKFGHAASSVYSRIEQAGRLTGIDFNFDAIERTPDSRPVHELIIAAGNDGYGLSERFYQAYFLDGKDISNSDIQEEILESSNLSQISVLKKIIDAKKILASDLTQANHLGIDGVPFFVFNNQVSLAGAHPENILLTAIDTAVTC